jgi:hypothetical protein
MVTGIESLWTLTDFEHLEMIPKGDSVITAFPVSATKDGRITCLRYIFEGEAARVTNLSIVSDSASIFRSSFELSHSRICHVVTGHSNSVARGGGNLPWMEPTLLMKSHRRARGTREESG